MGWRLGADVVVVLHFAFVLFVIAGGFVAWRWPKTAFVHVPVVAYAVLIELAGFTCPLTPLEKYLRRQARTGGYEDGFVEHYILRLLYPGPITTGVRLVLAGAVLAVNAVAYVGLWHRVRPTRPRP